MISISLLDGLPKPKNAIERQAWEAAHIIRSEAHPAGVQKTKNKRGKGKIYIKEDNPGPGCTGELLLLQ